jgi:hypothetical protein
VGAIRHGIPQELVLFLKDKSGIKRFIETGTLGGDSAAWAAQHFGHVLTIEAKADIAQKACERFITSPNIEVVFGDSAKVLEYYARGEPAIFWLDAHWMGPGSNTAGDSGDECPVVRELLAINEYNLEDIILIDDARYFLGPPVHPHDAYKWPDLSLIVKLLTRYPRAVFVYEDVIIAVPTLVAGPLIKWLQDRATEAWLNPK